MKVNTKLNMPDYFQLVRDMSDGFFDENGLYAPQYGMLNVAREFYNHCVVESKFDKKHNHNITNAMNMEELISDKEFMTEFNKAKEYCDDYFCDFGNAYRDTIDIVNSRKTGIGGIIHLVANALMKVGENLDTDTVNTLISEYTKSENIELPPNDTN